MWGAPLGLVLVLLATAGEGHTAMLICAALAAGLYLFLWIKLRSGWRRLEAIQAGAPLPIADPAKAAAEQSEALMESEIADRDLHLLLSLPTPRPVRMRKQSKIGIGITFGLFWLMAIFFATIPILMRQENGPASLTGGMLAWWVGMVAFALMFPVFLMQFTRRQKDLMTDGDVSLGRITQQWNTRYGPRVRYSFADKSGNTLAGRGRDVTNTYFEGMTVPVFFNPANSKKNVIACGAAYEVVLPGQPH